jgi:NAD/NADP transhydrogenase alpha subunit
VVPAAVKRLTDAGLEVSVERGAGSAAGLADDAYSEAGADVRDGAAQDADVLVSVQPPDIGQVKQLNARVGGTPLSAAHTRHGSPVPWGCEWTADEWVADNRPGGA